MNVYLYRCYQDGTYILGRESDWQETKREMKYDAQSHYTYDLICVVYTGYDEALRIAEKLANGNTNKVCDLIHKSW